MFNYNLRIVYLFLFQHQGYIIFINELQTWRSDQVLSGRSQEDKNNE